MRLTEPLDLLFETLDPLLLLGEAAADVLKSLLELLVRLDDLVVDVAQFLATGSPLELLADPAGHLLDVAVEFAGVLLEPTLDVVMRCGPGWRALVSGGNDLPVELRTRAGLRARLRTGMRRHRRMRWLRAGPRALRTRPTETGLDGIELADDQLELSGDMGMRIGMRPRTSAEIQPTAVDLDGDRVMVGRRTTSGPRRHDLDPVRHAVRADLEREGANRLRRARRDHRRSRCARRAMGDRRRGRCDLEWPSGLTAVGLVAEWRPRLSDARTTPPVIPAALRHDPAALRPGRRLGGSGVRWAVVEGATPHRPRAVSTGSRPIATPFRSAVLTVAVGPIRTGAVPGLVLLEERDQRAHGLVGAPVGGGGSGRLAGGTNDPDLDARGKEERRREKRHAAPTDRHVHGE